MLVAVSVDLDGIGEYRALHGLRPAGGEDPVYAIGLARALAWAEALHVPMSLFAIGRDLETEQNAERIARAARAGHAVENHSYGHRYDLGRLPPAQIAAEVRRGDEAIARVTGRRPAGFRAPGYAAAPAIAAAGAAAGHRFDASLFPCPSYWAAKAVAIAAIAAGGGRGASVLKPDGGEAWGKRCQVQVVYTQCGACAGKACSIVVSDCN